jgi:hypothetical protein
LPHQHTNNPDRGEHNSQSYEERIRTFHSGIIAVFTTVLAVVSVYQWFAISNQGTIANKDLQITIETNRPVIIMNTGFFGRDDATGKWLVSFPYKNSGHWTAHFIGFDIKSYIGAAINPVNPKVVKAHPTCEPAKDDTMPLGPQDGYQRAVEILPQPSSDQVEAIYKGTSSLYVVGCVAYRDDLGNRYVSTVCQFYVPNTQKVPNAFGFCALQTGTQPNYSYKGF